MIRPTGSALEIYLCVEPVDMRKQSAGLATLVQDALDLDPLCSKLFAFTNRRKSMCRILYWERNGFVLWTKKLEKARFAWPKRSDTVVTLDSQQLNLLLDGYDVWSFQPHETLRYLSMY